MKKGKKMIREDYTRYMENVSKGEDRDLLIDGKVLLERTVMIPDTETDKEEYVYG